MSAGAVSRSTLFEEVWLRGRLEPNLDRVYPSATPPTLLDERTSWPRLTHTKLAVAHAAGRVSRTQGRGGGSTAPGRLLLRMAPRAIRTLAARIPRGATVISATNGKTTTARMLAAILEADGRAVVHNREGANTHWGVCTALTEGTGDSGVFEVDEAWLPLLVAELRPRLVVLGNLFRDRLDGYGELDRLRVLWRDLLRGAAAPPAVAVNADDPVLAGPAGVLDGIRAKTVLFGVADRSVGSASPRHPHEGARCRGCGGRLLYSRAYIGQLGHFHCPGCGGVREPLLAASNIREDGLDGVQFAIVHPASAPLTAPISRSSRRSQTRVRLGVPGLHNVYNALAASAAAWWLGVAPETIRAGLESLQPPFGRGEVVSVQGCKVRLLLVKNPVGMNETLRLIRANATSPLHMWLALNDQEPDGRDVSWIWDADFEPLAGLVCCATCSGRRAAELAVRLKYAAWECPLYVDEDIEASFRRALARRPESLVVLPTYTALLALRGVLNRLGVSVSDWGRAARTAVG